MEDEKTTTMKHSTPRLNFPLRIQRFENLTGMSPQPNSPTADTVQNSSTLEKSNFSGQVNSDLMVVCPNCENCFFTKRPCRSLQRIKRVYEVIFGAKNPP